MKDTILGMFKDRIGLDVALIGLKISSDVLNLIINKGSKFKVIKKALKGYTFKSNLNIGSDTLLLKETLLTTQLNLEDSPLSKKKIEKIITTLENVSNTMKQSTLTLDQINAN